MDHKIKPLGKQHFTYLKGIAILAVILSHIGNYSGKTWFTPLGGIGVAMFLFCSGYGLMSSYYEKGLKNFWKKKLIAIYLPFVFIELVFAIINRNSFVAVLLDILLIKKINPLGWYMQYLAVCYILFYVVTRWIYNIKLRFLIWGFASVLSFVLCPNLQAEQAISFVCGLLVAQINHTKNLQFHKKHALVIGATAILCSICFLAIKQLPVIREQSHYLVTALNLLLKSGFAAGIICITVAVCPMSKIVIAVGKISYPLYLVHGYFMIIMAKNVFGNYFIDSTVMLLLSFAAAIVLHVMIVIFNKRKGKKYDTESISNQQ